MVLLAERLERDRVRIENELESLGPIETPTPAPGAGPAPTFVFMN
jgi:hypothetical protein